MGCKILDKGWSQNHWNCWMGLCHQQQKWIQRWWGHPMERKQQNIKELSRIWENWSDQSSQVHGASLRCPDSSCSRKVSPQVQCKEPAVQSRCWRSQRTNNSVWWRNLWRKGNRQHPRSNPQRWWSHCLLLRVAEEPATRERR